MRFARVWFARLGEFVFKQRRDLELAAEMESHLQMHIADGVRSGLAPEEAKRQAVLALGGIDQAKENYRDRRGFPVFEAVIHDVRFGFRMLAQKPGFTSLAVMTVAIGIGATTAIFTLVHAVLLTSLPVANPNELYRVGDTDRCCNTGSIQGNWSIFSYEQYKFFRDNTPGFVELAALEAGTDLVGVRPANSTQPAQSMRSEFVSGNYFSMLGLRPYAGRVLTSDDDRKGASPVAVISYRAWQEKFGAEPLVVGRGVIINNQPFTVVGVAPPGFFGDRLTNLPAFWIPIVDEPLIDPASALETFPQQYWLDLIGRISPHANPTEIRAHLEVELRQWLLSSMDPLQSEWGWKNLIPKQTVGLSPGGAGIQRLRDEYLSSLRLLMWISALVLAIACANVANLMLVRATTRKLQTSVQAALGAPVSRQVRQVLIESGLLALMGGFIGVAVAFAVTSLILHVAFQNTSVAIHASPSMPVLGFTFAVSVLTGILFGIVPAWITANVDPADALRGAGKVTRRGGWTQRLLVITQAALSVVLLATALLLMQSLRNMQRQNFGFQTTNRYIAHIDPRMAGYKTDEMQPVFHKLHDSLAAIPGVSSVSFSLYTPMEDDNWSESVYIEGQAPPPPASEQNVASWLRVSPGYFETLGTKIVQGRSFSDDDTPTSQRVAVVNQTFAKKFFNGESPIGKHFGYINMKRAGDFEIVGVTQDTKYREPTKEASPMFFLPSTQGVTFDSPRFMAFEDRSHVFNAVEFSTLAEVPHLEEMVRQALAEVNPSLAVIDFRSFENQVDISFSQQKMIATLTSLFGLLALLLACVGLYGVSAYSVERRTNEIGIRSALGAERSQIVSLFLSYGAKLAGMGVAAGLLAAVTLTRLMRGLLFGVSAADPLTFAGVALLLITVALMACYIPARRATRVDPAVALRHE